MAVAQGYGKTVTSGSVFAYDTGDTRNSYIGQPTTNDYGSSFRDFTGTGYSLFGEWVSTEPTRFTKTYYPNLATPIGPGGTLVEESGTGGYHHLSRYGGGNESGAHSLSCYIYPLVSGITDFCIGMLGDNNNNIRFNLDTRVITYGGGISNTNAFIKDVPGWPGWLRVGANIEGRGGGWVGCFGYSSYTSYTGTAGGKKAYITGIQYEYTTQPTSFTTGTRSATQGLLPLVGNNTLDLSNVSFDSNAQMTFDGTNDYLDFTAPNLSGTATVEMVCKIGSGYSDKMFMGWSAYDVWCGSGHLGYNTGNGDVYGISSSTVSSLGLVNNWKHYIFEMRSDVAYTNNKIYINGASQTLSQQLSGEAPGNRNFNSGNGRIADWRLTGYYMPMDCAVFKVYNRALSAGEVRQNYLHYKTRFNLS